MLFYKEKLLSSGQLKRLSEHKYSFENISVLDPFLQPYWNLLVSKTPLWLAPNLLTLSGLIVNILTSLILIWYCPDAQSEPPRWACFCCGLGLFIYQSLDAIDGKQARRTRTSSPLGELFDHGCDSVSTVFVALAACVSCQLGQYPLWMFFQCFCAMTLFYCAQWQAYVSGTMRFGRVDVTEAQISIILIHFISAAFGSQIWMTEMPFIVYWQLRFFIALMTVTCCSVALFNIGKVILSGGAGRNGSTVAGTSVLSPIIPFTSVLLPAYIIFQKSETQLYETHPTLYILAFGIVSAKITNRLVVAHMTRSELDYLDSCLIGPALLFFNQYFNFFIDEYYVLWACLLWVTFDFIRYSAVVCNEICDHLRIHLFRIPYPPVTGANGSSVQPAAATTSAPTSAAASVQKTKRPARTKRN